MSTMMPETIDRSVAALIPEELARELRCVPVRDDGRALAVAFANEVDDLALERLATVSSREIQAFLIEPEQLDATYAAVYPQPEAASAQRASGESAPPEAPSADGLAGEESAMESLDMVGGDDPVEAPVDEDGDGVPDISDLRGIVSGALDEVQLVKEGSEEQDKQGSAYGIEIEANSPPVVKLVNGVLIKALNLRASDIHIEPMEKELIVRVRVDGELHRMMKLPAGVSHKITSRIKIMANLNITERRLPQDGRFKVSLGANRVVEFRLSTMPSAFGEKIVMRVLGGNKLKGDVGAMGFNPRDQEAVITTLKAPWGLVLVTGPTGSGKTTSLYTMLKSLNTPNRNVLTAEDPIEYNLPGLTQVPINAAVGMTFEKALRAFLRQDPDVILVGEIRDRETAEIAAKAAMTGHMVLSTLHTNDAPSSVLRFKNMGVEPFLIASALKLVIAQRLVRLLCPKCKIPTKLSDEDKVGLKPSEVRRLGQVFRARGCEECGNVGYKGRRPVFEVMPLGSPTMRKAVLEETGGMIEGVAREEGMTSLRENALQLASEGIISFQEVLRVGVAA